MDAANLLEMNNLNKQFPGVKALDDVTLHVQAGTVHALMGENGAGKSTLMKCLFGIYSKDSGEILLEGEKVNIQRPDQAMRKGIAMVHQELNQVHTRSVMENMWLNRFPKMLKVPGTVDHRKMFTDTKKVLDDLNIKIDPRAIISTLSVAQRQMVEIAKAVSFNAKIIVLDEPTSSLADEEVEKLFEIINTLKERGCGIVYISHRMNEILKISDYVTIMRDGKWISTDKSSELTIQDIIKKMVGREMTNMYPPRADNLGETVFRAENMTCRYRNVIDAGFKLKKGEILGFAGLVGAGRTELMESIFGLSTMKSGKIYLDGKEIHNRNSREAKKNGFSLVTEERRQTGIFGVLNIKENTVICNLKKYLVARIYLRNKPMIKDTLMQVKKLRTKTPGINTKIKSLSGGNQQKVILGRWLLTNPKILLMDEPTRGIDVGAKYEIYQIMIDLANKGNSIVMVSSELPELLGVCNRIVVMSNGRIAGEVDPVNTTQEEILTLAAKYVE